MDKPFWKSIIDKYYPEGTTLRDKYLSHCHDVAELALSLNSQFRKPINPDDVEAAAMLHDIGIFMTNAPSIGCHGDEPYIRHGVLGAELLRKEGVSEKFSKICERHTGTGISHKEIKKLHLPLSTDRTYFPRTRLEKLICYADKFFSKSGDGKRKPMEKVIAEMLRYGKDNLKRFQRLSDYIEEQKSDLNSK